MDITTKNFHRKNVTRSIALLSLTLLLTFTLLILNGCTVSKMMVESGTSSYWKAHYDYLNGEMCHNLTVPDGKTSLHVELTAEEGSLALSVKDSDGNKLYTGNGLKNETFDVGASGEITVYVTGSKHKGSFDFSFS